jgi:hypothetical protein
MQRRFVMVALVLIAISNLAHLPAYRRVMTGAPWFGPIYTWSEDLKASIRDGATRPGLGSEFVRFYAFHEKRRKSSK